MKINTSLTGVANLLALVNADNSTALTLGQLDFAAPSVAAGTGGRNTSATLTMKANQVYQGSQTFSYIRLPVGGAITAPVTSYGYTNETTWADLKTAIAAGLGVRREDITFANLPNTTGGKTVTWDNETETVAVQDGEQAETNVSAVYGFDDPTGPDFDVAAVAGSYLYTGTQAVDLTWNRPEVSTVLTVTDLNGFEVDDGEV